MAKISALDVTNELTGEEYLPVVQGARTKRATLHSLRALITPFLQYWYKGDTGDTGPSNNTRLTLEDLKAAALTDKTSLYEGALYTWSVGDFSTLVGGPAFVESDHAPSNEGAWVRQGAQSITTVVPTPGAVPEALSAVLGRAVLTPEQFGGVGYLTSDEAKVGVDSTAAVQAMATAGGTLRLPVTGNGRWYKVGTVSWPSHTRCSKLRLFVRDSTVDVVPFRMDGRVSPKTDFVFSDIEVHGNRLGQKNLTTSGLDGQRPGIEAQGRVSKVVLERPKIWYCATDGIWIYHDGRDSDPAALNPSGVNDLFFTDFVIIDPDLQWNGRHGGSAEGIDGLTITGGVMKNNGMHMPGYPKNPYSDAGNARLSGGADASGNGLGNIYGRAWDCESYLLGTRCKNVTIDGADCRGNAGGSLLFYHRKDASNPADCFENTIVRNCKLDDQFGANGDGCIATFAVNGASSITYAGSDAFKVIRLENNEYGINYINIGNATTIFIEGGRETITASPYAVIFSACADVRVCSLTTYKPIFGRPSPITITSLTGPSGWSFAGQILSNARDLPGGRYRYRYAFGFTPNNTDQQVVRVTVPVAWRIIAERPTVINNETGGFGSGNALDGDNGVNEVRLYLTPTGVGSHGCIFDFIVEPA